jgi:hypothetical protein
LDKKKSKKAAELVTSIIDTFITYPVIHPTEFQGIFLSISDINNDKQLDIIVGHTNNNKISVHFNMGNGTFTNEMIFSTSSFPKDAKPVDINGDGKIEIIVIVTNFVE